VFAADNLSCLRCIVVWCRSSICCSLSITEWCIKSGIYMLYTGRAIGQFRKWLTSIIAMHYGFIEHVVIVMLNCLCPIARSTSITNVPFFIHQLHVDLQFVQHCDIFLGWCCAHECGWSSFSYILNEIVHSDGAAICCVVFVNLRFFVMSKVVCYLDNLGFFPVHFFAFVCIF